MDGSGDYQTTWSKSDKERQIYYLYIEYKIWYKLTYLQNRNRLTDFENKLKVTKGEGGSEKLGA